MKIEIDTADLAGVVEALEAQPHTSTSAATGRLREALEAVYGPRCAAHGNQACPECSRITLSNLAEGGACRHCTVYEQDGMHWDTCQARLRGPIFATQAETRTHQENQP